MTNKQIQTSKDNELMIPNLKHPTEFIEFCNWYVIPKQSRKPKTMEALARKLGLSALTLTGWKSLPAFNHNLKALVRLHVGNDFPKLIKALTNKALTGDTKAIELTLKWLGELQETEVQIDKAVVFTWQRDKGLTEPIDVVDTQ